MVSVSASIPAVPEIRLPPLREDLKLFESARGPDGAPHWTVYDPVRNSYFGIGWMAMQCLTRWSVGKADRLIEQVIEQTSCRPTLEDVEALIIFLHQNELTVDAPGGGSKGFLEMLQRSKRSNLQVWFGRLMMVRIPLWRPERLLPATMNWIEPLFSAPAAKILLVLGLIGLFLVSRQWDSFWHTFEYFFNITGALVFAAALIVVKILHELGHAYALYRATDRVPRIGLAIIAMVMPILYTDASDTYRLHSRRQRLTIGAAGMGAEIYIAVASTWLWCLLPDGVYRSAAFVFASSGWIMSLAVNLNPLMRFDGYYLFADWLGVDNLMSRSVAMGQWQLRRVLFATPEAMPEPGLAGKRWTLVVYAWLGWVYRFLVYLGIAVLVYSLVFKLAGIILFVAEIMLLIIKPIWTEIRSWWAQRQMLFASRRAKFSGLGALLLFGLLIVPWQSTVHLPAVMQASRSATIYSPLPARLVALHKAVGEWVVEGELLVTLESGELDALQRELEYELRGIQIRLDRRVASPEDLKQVQALYQRLEEVQSQLEGVAEQRQLLRVSSPVAGVVTDIDRQVHVGRWVNPDTKLMFVAELTQAEVVAMVHEKDIARFGLLSASRFVPENPEHPTLEIEIDSISFINDQELKLDYLASVLGGDVAVVADGAGSYSPVNAVYRVDFKPIPMTMPVSQEEDSWPVWQAVRGTVLVEAEAESLLVRIYRAVARLLVRESGF